MYCLLSPQNLKQFVCDCCHKKHVWKRKVSLTLLTKQKGPVCTEAWQLLKKSVLGFKNKYEENIATNWTAEEF